MADRVGHGLAARNQFGWFSRRGEDFSFDPSHTPFTFLLPSPGGSSPRGLNMPSHKQLPLPFKPFRQAACDMAVLRAFPVVFLPLPDY